MAKRRHSVVGCAFGFGMAGSGLGVLLGLCCAAVVRWISPEWFDSLRTGGRGHHVTDYILRTIPLGGFGGTLAGVYFAIRSNRSQEREV